MSGNMEAKEILKKHIAQAASLTDEQFAYFFSHFKSLSCKKGEALIQAGKPVVHEYFVISGCLKAFFVNDDIRTYILQFAMPTWWTSDYAAMYNHTNATITVDCITDAEVLCLSNDDRERLCSELHQIEHFFRWRTNRGYVASQKRLLSFMNNDTKARYEELLSLYPQIGRAHV